MKRWMWAVAAVVLAVAGVVVWLVPDSVDVAVITAINANGTVEWADAEYRRTEENHSAAFVLSEERHVSKLAADAVIRAAQGCGVPTDIQLSWNGLGAVPCSREEFLAMKTPPYAPHLEFNGDGEITEILGRYHP